MNGKVIESFDIYSAMSPEERRSESGIMIKDVCMLSISFLLLFVSLCCTFVLNVNQVWSILFLEVRNAFLFAKIERIVKVIFSKLTQVISIFEVERRYDLFLEIMSWVLAAEVNVELFWDRKKLKLVFFAIRSVKSRLMFKSEIGREIYTELVDVFLKLIS